MAAQNWVMIISELRRYQVCKQLSDTTFIDYLILNIGGLLQVGHDSDVWPRPRGQTGPGAEILRVWSTLSSGQLRWKVMKSNVW